MSSVPQLSVYPDVVAAHATHVEGQMQTLHAFILARIRATSITAVAAYCQVPELTIREYALGIQPPAIALERMRARYREAVPSAFRVPDSLPVSKGDEPLPQNHTRPRADEWAFVRGGPAPLAPRDPSARPRTRGHARTGPLKPRTLSRRDQAGPGPGVSLTRNHASEPVAAGVGDPPVAADAPTIDQIRSLVKRHADARSARAVAREVGMSPAGLINFIRGAAPYPRTQRALREWRDANAHVPLPGPVARHEDPLAAIPEDEIGEALRVRIQETSLRQVAGEIGITHRALQLLMAGETKTRDRTRRKLRTWYLRQRAETGAGADEETARAAIGLLVDFLPAASRARATAAILRAVRQESSEAAVAPPAWAA